MENEITEISNVIEGIEHFSSLFPNQEFFEFGDSVCYKGMKGFFWKMRIDFYEKNKKPYDLNLWCTWVKNCKFDSELDREGLYPVKICRVIILEKKVNRNK